MKGNKKRFSPVAHPGFGKEGGHNRACGGETPAAGHNQACGGETPAATGRVGVKPQPQTPEAKGVWGRSFQPPINFYTFDIKKMVILTHSFSETGHAVSAVTMDRAKMFSQFMSKSRSLAKISERRLQPLLI